MVPNILVNKDTISPFGSTVPFYELVFEVPEDEVITEFELKGKPIISINEKSKSIIAVNKLVENTFDKIKLK